MKTVLGLRVTQVSQVVVDGDSLFFLAGQATLLTDEGPLPIGRTAPSTLPGLLPLRDPRLPSTLFATPIRRGDAEDSVLIVRPDRLPPRDLAALALAGPSSHLHLECWPIDTGAGRDWAVLHVRAQEP